jgi:hypothetical protein
MHTASQPLQLLVLDGPGGPSPQWYLPRLCRDYDVRVIAKPSGDHRKDAERSNVFASYCRYPVIPAQGDALIEAVKLSQDWRVDGVLGFSELLITTVHATAIRLGLPSNTPGSLGALRNKHEQRSLLAAAGIPVPRFSRVDSYETLKHGADIVGNPAVLKPIVGVGSMATYHVSAETDLESLWSQASAYYAADPRGTRTPEFLLEEFLIGEDWHGDPRYGPYASVESVVQDGAVTHLAVTDRLPLSDPFRENGEIIPSALPKVPQNSLMRCASDAIAALGITNSLVHTEIMFTPAGPRVIEVNSRVGGGVTEMLYYSYDYDVVAAAAAVATGRPTSPRGPLLRSSAFFTPQSPAANVVIAKAPTVQDLMACEPVQHAELPYSAGDRPAWERGTADGCIARIVAAADSTEELLRLAQYLNSGSTFAYRPNDPPAEE